MGVIVTIQITQPPVDPAAFARSLAWALAARR